jgi:hypothetical protein
MPCVTFFLFPFHLCVTAIGNNAIVKKGGTSLWLEMVGFIKATCRARSLSQLFN